MSVNSKPKECAEASYPEGALDAAIRAALYADPVLTSGDHSQHVMLPPGFKLHELPNPSALPRYINASVEVDDRNSLEQYVNRFWEEGTVVFADYQSGCITSRLDWHCRVPEPETDENGVLIYPWPPHVRPAAHSCTFRLKPSEEFSRWSMFEGEFHSQDAFAAFLEENAADVVDPDPAVLIEISRDLEGSQGVTFKSSTRLENGDRSFRYETETKAHGDIRIPREFVLSIPLFEGEEPVPLRCAFRWRINAGALQMAFVWRRVEYQRRAYFNQMAALVAENTGRPVFIGRVK
jgi:uncharacterized protein YfdQ (DUF2303 family)